MSPSTPLTVAIVHDAIGSATHEAARALARHAPDDVVARLASVDDALRAVVTADGTPDVLLVLAHGSAAAIRAAFGEHPPALVTAVNVGWPDDLLTVREAYAASDLLLLSSDEYWRRLGLLPRTAVARWGFDEDVFAVRTPINRRGHVVIWSGPVRESERTGYAHLIEPLRREMADWRYGCEILPTDVAGSPGGSPEARAAAFNAGTIFVCTSRSEGTPVPALEAAACGCTIVSTRVGIMADMVVHDGNGWLIDRSARALLAGISAASSHYRRLAQQMQLDAQAWRWSERAPDFFAAARAAVSARARTRGPVVASRPDLSRDVTVFVTSLGAPSRAACRAALDQQDCAFALEWVEDVRPLSAALQQMIDRCRTPYYVQVDEDMILFPHAVRTLHDGIAAAPRDVAGLVGELHDVHLDQPIQGVKIWRHDVVRRYPWNAEPNLVRRLEQMASEGHHVITVPVPNDQRSTALGLHVTPPTPAMLYDRYRTLERLRRTFPRAFDWVDPLPALLLARIMDEGSTADLPALLGMLDGMLAGPLAAGAEVKTGASTPASGDLARLLEDARGALPIPR